MGADSLSNCRATDRDALRTHTALQDPPAAGRMKILQRRTQVLSVTPDQATFFARCGNIARRAASSMSVLKVCLSFSARARTAAGRALISAR
jgi:hypothetical protein